MRILAVGGGGFMMEDGLSPLDAYLSRLICRPNPRVCFIPTACGDLPHHIDKFYEIFGSLGCEPSHLPLFRKPSHNALDPAKLPEALSNQDIVYVGGGLTRSALAVWREWGVDSALRVAGEMGTVLAGMSAGALCWFDSGISASYTGDDYTVLQCLGFLPGACSVHFSADANRRPSLHKALIAGQITSGIAIDDYAAVLFDDGRICSVVSWAEGATAYQVALRNGSVEETSLKARKVLGIPLDP